MDLSVIVIAVVITALVFDFTNGFHDTANAMATSIATGAFELVRWSRMFRFQRTVHLRAAVLVGDDG